jgi:hypothetical protein
MRLSHSYGQRIEPQMGQFLAMLCTECGRPIGSGYDHILNRDDMIDVTIRVFQMTEGIPGKDTCPKCGCNHYKDDEMVRVRVTYPSDRGIEIFIPISLAQHDEDACERAWHLLQVIEGGEDELPLHLECRSSMVGDIYEIEGRFYIVATAGFEAITPEQAEALGVLGVWDFTGRQEILQRDISPLG